MSSLYPQWGQEALSSLRWLKAGKCVDAYDHQFLHSEQVKWWMVSIVYLCAICPEDFYFGFGV